MSSIDKQALVISQREKHDWSQAVMRDCDFCQQWALTVRHSDGGCICASCCDSEYTTALSSALVVALDELEAKNKRIAELEATAPELKMAHLINKFYERYPLAEFKSDTERSAALGYFMAGAELQCFGEFINYAELMGDE